MEEALVGRRQVLLHLLPRRWNQLIPITMASSLPDGWEERVSRSTGQSRNRFSTSQCCHVLYLSLLQSQEEVQYKFEELKDFEEVAL